MPAPSDEPGAAAVEKTLLQGPTGGPHGGGGSTYTYLDGTDAVEEAMLAWLLDTQAGIYG